MNKIFKKIWNKNLNPGFKELRSTIADHQAPSWGQMHFLSDV